MASGNEKKVADESSANATKAKKIATYKKRNGLMAAIRGSKTKDEFQFANEAYFSLVQGQKKPERIKDPKTGKISTQRTGGRKSSARYVVMELIRAALEFTNGIAAPMSPKHLYGVEPDHMVDWYDAMRKKAKKGLEEYYSCKGKKCFRKQRDSTVVMIGAVFSYPGLSDEDDDRFVQWRKETLEFIKKHYGAALVTVILHEDENFAHIHAIAALDGKPIKFLTIGNKEAWAAQAAGATGKAITAAYKAGCVKWQDDYFQAVCEPLGLQRKGQEKKHHKPLNEARNIALDHKEQELLEDADAVIKIKKRQEDDQISLELAESELRKMSTHAALEFKAVEAAKTAIQQADFDLQRRDIRMQSKEQQAHHDADRLISAAREKAAAIVADAEKASSEFLAASRASSGSKQLARALEAALGTLDGEQRFLAASAAQKAYRSVIQPSQKI